MLFSSNNTLFKSFSSTDTFLPQDSVTLAIAQDICAHEIDTAETRAALSRRKTRIACEITDRLTLRSDEAGEDACYDDDK